jgi:GT2 family glycosyltransferase
VDASSDERTREVVADFEGVLYLHNRNAVGRMTASRNIGLKSASGGVIAFLDDDAFAHPTWLENLLATYCDPAVGAVGGRALNRQPGEETRGVEAIGRLLPSGTLTGNFGADPKQIIEVDHVMGCNMSFRREVIARLGGFREDYPGISGLREDTDMCLRVRMLGFKILFNPAACVEHLGAPQAVGRRFDVRYEFYSAQNHCLLLVRNYGFFSPVLRRYLIFAAASGIGQFCRRIAGAFARSGALSLGIATGLARGVALRIIRSSDVVRKDPEGLEVSCILKKTHDSGARPERSE